jgi:hypothetical protein
MITLYVELLQTHTHVHKLAPTVTSSLPLLGKGFQRRSFPSSGLPNYSRPQPTASHSNSYQRLCHDNPLTNLLTHQPTPHSIKSKPKSHYDRQSVGQSILVSGTHLGPATNFSFSLRFSFRQLRFVTLYRPL